MLELGSQESSIPCFQHLANFVSHIPWQCWQARLWDEITRFQLRVSTWSYKNNWSWYLELQVWFRSLALIPHGLGDRPLSIGTVRLALRLLNKLHQRLRWPTVARAWMPCGASGGRASPVSCPAQSCQARAHYITPRTRSLHPRAHIFNSLPPPSPFAAAQQLPRHS